MSEILKQQTQKTSFLRSLTRNKFFEYFIMVAVTIVFAIYVGDIFFGNQSLDIMLDLQNEKNKLNKEIEYLKVENAKLQKKYFELLGLEPDNKWSK